MLSGTVPILPVFACPFTGLFIFVFTLYAAVCIHVSQYIAGEKDLRLERELAISESDRCLELGFSCSLCVNNITVHPRLLSQLPTLLIVDPDGSARFSQV